MTSRRRGLSLGSLLLPVVAAAILVLMPGRAEADFSFETCPKPDNRIRIGGAEITTSSGTWRRLNQAKLSQRFVSPAAREGGVPVFPVFSGNDTGQEISAKLAGSFLILGPRGRRVRAVVTSFIRQGNGATWIRGKVSGREMRVFRVRGGTIKRKSGLITGVEVRGGRTEISGAFASELRERVGFGLARPGMNWGSLYLDWSNSPEPDVTPPTPAPPFLRPDGAADLVAGEITWNVRPEWIRYVATGDPASAIAPAQPLQPVPVPGSPSLVYSFTLPFSGGWVEPGSGEVSRASVEGKGGVYFRYCGDGNVYKGINFAVRDPEIRIDGGSSSLVFSVEGVDETPLSPERTVVVALDPRAVVPSDSGPSTTWREIPGTVPLGVTGVFGGFYAPGTPFGSVDLTIRRGP